jgi:hypothetical protein
VTKAYLVEARLAYEVQADTVDEALRFALLMVRDDRAVSFEYSLGERREPIAPAELRTDPKPVYTISEAALLLGTSSVSDTMDLYSHSTPSLQAEAATKLDAALQIAMAPASKVVA